LPHPFLNLKTVAVKEPQPPTVWAAERLLQNWAAFGVADVVVVAAPVHVATSIGVAL